MAITESDIKLFASQRLTDETDGGGRATSLVVQDGVKNNLFPDLGSVARSVGALHLRKAFMHVTSPNADTLFDAHAILDDVPDDPATSAVLLPATAASDSRADVVAAISAQGSAYPFKGSVALAAAASVGARALTVSDTRVALLPLSKTSTPQTDAIPTIAEVVGFAPVGAPVPVTAQFSQAAGFHRVILFVAGVSDLPMEVSSISGTCLVNGQAGTISSDGTTVTLSGNGKTYTNLPGQASAGSVVVELNSTATAVDVSAVNVTVQMLGRVSRPRQSARTLVTEGNQAFTYALSVPPGTVAGSESVTASFPPLNSSQVYRANFISPSLVWRIGGPGGDPTVGEFGESIFPPFPQNSRLASGLVNRASGAVTLVFSQMPLVGSDIVVSYAAGGDTQNLAIGSLSNGGTLAGNTVTATLPGGHVIVSLWFTFAGAPGSPVTLRTLQDGSAGGSVNVSTGVITMPLRNGQTIDRWLALTAPANVEVSSVALALPNSLEVPGLVVSGTTAAGAAFTATADPLGRFATAQVNGFYSKGSGVTPLEFNSPVRANTLRWTGEKATYFPSGFDLGGLSMVSLSADGKVPVLRVGDLAVVHDTQRMAAATVSAAQVIDTGRTVLSRVRIIGANGTIHAVLKAGAQTNGGATADLAAGTVTINSTAGYSQPVVVEHRIENMVAIATVGEDGTVGLSNGLLRAFPITSRLSSAISMGDLGARVGQPFAQNTWTTVWQDTVIGSPPAADYQHAAFPISSTNPGGVTDRWAIILTTNTSFRIVGENSGEIFGTWSTNANAAPINPVTNTPYFTIQSAGWGGGWAQGNVLRFNTTGALAPMWVARCTQPSNPFDGIDSLTISMRGEANA